MRYILIILTFILTSCYKLELVENAGSIDLPSVPGGGSGGGDFSKLTSTAWEIPCYNSGGNDITEFVRFDTTNGGEYLARTRYWSTTDTTCGGGTIVDMAMSVWTSITHLS